MTTFSTNHINYLERGFLATAASLSTPPVNNFEFKAMDSVCWLRVTGITDFFHEEGWHATLQQLMADVLSGSHSTQVPLVFLITSSESELGIYFGAARGDVIESLERALVGSFPGIQITLDESSAETLSPNVDSFLSQMSHAALICGTPGDSGKFEDEKIGLLKLDRVVRGMYGHEWAYLVVATPVEYAATDEIYKSILEEMRAMVDQGSSTNNKDNPLLVEYGLRLKVLLDKVQNGKGRGLWHVSTAVLTADASSLQRAAGLVRAVMSSGDSGLDPVRHLNVSSAASSIRSRAILFTPAPSGPGKFSYLYKYLSLLNSDELAHEVHLLSQEMEGYFVRDYARFDVAVHQPIRDLGPSISLGKILDVDRHTGQDYLLHRDDLTRHLMIAGTPGSGKSTTLRELLKRLWKLGIPFLVIESAKSEYRRLLVEAGLGDELHVFTLGRESVSPFRLNPFEIREGVSVQSHIDLIKSVFSASFGLWGPLPHILERALIAIYEDKGWDIASSTNRRGLHAKAQPTLDDLKAKIPLVVDELGYDREMHERTQAALLTRISSMTTASKGLMLNTPTSFPIDYLLSKPVILEIEYLEDDAEKAFVIGLIMLFIYEFRKVQGTQEAPELQHLTVIEEAHRLLKNVPRFVDPSIGNAEGEAVETIINIMAEMRAYRQGLAIVEQLPTKLAPEAVKLANTKLVHRLTSDDDIAVMGNVMNMSERQHKAIRHLPVGQAVVHGLHDDHAHKIEITFESAEDAPVTRDSGDDLVERRIAQLRLANNDLVLATPLPGYLRDEIKRIIAHSEFQESFTRWMMSSALVTDIEVATASLQSVKQAIRKLRRDSGTEAQLDALVIAAAVESHLDRRGSQFQLPFDRIATLTRQTVEIWQYMEMGQIVEPSFQAWQASYLAAFTTSHHPFAGCARVCGNRQCFYRHHLETLLADRYLQQNLTDAIAKHDPPKRAEQIKSNVIERVSRRSLLSQVSETEQHIAGLCFVVQHTERIPEFDFVHRGIVIDEVISHLDHVALSADIGASNE